jgi:hypothetical protein
MLVILNQNAADFSKHPPHPTQARRRNQVHALHLINQHHHKMKTKQKIKTPGRADEERKQ